jgi:hypothetical protein
VRARLEANVGFDPEDMFGLRRALRDLPDELRDDFIAHWVELGELSDCDVEAVRRGAREAARDCALQGMDRMRAAWSTVARAMDAYVAWRANAGSAPSFS